MNAGQDNYIDCVMNDKIKQYEKEYGPQLISADQSVLKQRITFKINALIITLLE